jgi:hypothetical protein
MQYKEMQQLLQYHEHEKEIFMPNEIFEDLQSNIDNSPHISFSYSYIYFITWLYRYGKYGQIKELIDQKFLKKILGYHETYKKLDYLIKKNGVLEKIGYIKTTKNIPLGYKYNENGLEFHYINKQNDKYKNIPKNYKIKFPVKAFYRLDETNKNGTFFNTEKTHLIPFDVFLFCMTNNELGCTGFYLYAFFKYKIQRNGRYIISLDTLEKRTSIPNQTLCNYLDSLKKFNMISCDVQDYIIGIGRGNRKPNTYYVNEPEDFVITPKEYKKRKVMSYNVYMNVNYKFFNSIETKKHYQAKKLLFDLITQQKVKIIDHEGEIFEVFPNKYKYEFLHSESFILGNDIAPLYSSETKLLPCIKYFSNNFTPICDLKRHCGAIYDLPCTKCLEINLSTNFEKIKEIINFKPDIAWGYENKHRIWIEIHNTNKSTYRKMKFCYENGITLLEIGAKDILKCNLNKENNLLIFNNLTKLYEYIDKEKWKEMIIKEIEEMLNKYGYVYKKHLIDQLSGLLEENEIELGYKLILNKLNLIELKGATNKLVKDLKMYNVRKNTVILVKSNK